MARRLNRYSGIGGQAVLEGIMMKNKDKYSVAVRKPNGEIEVEIGNYQGVLHGGKLREIPFVRGIFNFIDSMLLGMRSLSYSASFAEDDSKEEPGEKATLAKPKVDKDEKFATLLVALFSVALAIGLFIVLPYYISSRVERYILNPSLVSIIEGLVRIAIFLLYVWSISLMKDIKRLYCYHGAEHKCINCIERGRALTVRNVMRSSKQHKRCGTSFIFFVLVVSIVLFFFIRVDNVFQRVLLRILLMPVVAGISYELIRLAGRSDNIIIKLLSAPGLLIQRLTTKEPDEDMVEVAIAAVEAVFDWRTFLHEKFGYDLERVEEEDDFL